MHRNRPPKMASVEPTRQERSQEKSESNAIMSPATGRGTRLSNPHNVDERPRPRTPIPMPAETTPFETVNREDQTSLEPVNNNHQELHQPAEGIHERSSDIPSGQLCRDEGCLLWGRRQKRSCPILKAKQSFECFNLQLSRPHPRSFAMCDIGCHGAWVAVGGIGSRSRRSLRARTHVLTTTVESDDDEFDIAAATRRRSKKKRNEAIGDKAISKSGYTCRGRVKQKAQKRVELLRLGERKVMKGWYNAGYIFPLGFKSKTLFRSSANLDAICVHECEITKGEFWPLPTFSITALDRPEEKLTSKSCTGCWSLVLKRINNEIGRRRHQGEKLPPPPKTAIAGPEYFGLIQPNILRKIESLDPEKRCELYWSGKLDRQAATENLAHVNGRKFHTSRRSRTRRRQEYWSDDGDENEDVAVDDDEGEGYSLGKWSTIGRFDRYKKRCMTRGTSSDCPEPNDDNPLPELIDLVTMQPVVTPAISPYGHVMGMATWRAWLSEHRVCPFTRNPLSVEQCTILTKNNIHKYREKIVQ